MKRHQFGLLVSTLPLVLNGVAWAAPNRLENSLTSGGMNIAPRYLERPGDLDLNLLGGFLNYPSNGGGLAGGQVALQARLTDKFQMLANLGPLTEIGLRGPIATLNGVSLGWDTRFRQDMYFVIQNASLGLSNNMAGIPMMGAVSQGLEAKLNAMMPLAGFNLFVSPVAAVLSNRSYAGIDAGLDWSWERLGLGYALSYHANLVNPAGVTTAIMPNELQHGLGLRYSMNDRFYLQANYLYSPADAYGIDTQQVLAGIGVRLHSGEGIKPAPVPTPTPVATPTPLPIATPVPQQTTPSISLQGRFYHSRLNEKPFTKPMTAYLKVRQGADFVRVATTSTTDSQGHYVFYGLPAGEYQVVYRNDDSLPNTAGVIVSDSVKVQEGTAPTVDLDLAWKADLAENSACQILISRDGKSILSYPRLPFNKELPQWVAKDRGKLRYFIKYWKKSGSFNGSSYYGQSRLWDLPE